MTMPALGEVLLLGTALSQLAIKNFESNLRPLSQPAMPLGSQLCSFRSN